MTRQLPNGFQYLPEYFDRPAQRKLLAAVTDAARGDAPFFQGRMPRTGQAISVVGSNFGPLGWVADIKGYRYETLHPKTGKPWPPMPQVLLGIWGDLTGYPAPPEACLINWYREGNKMGMHVDRDYGRIHIVFVSIHMHAHFIALSVPVNQANFGRGRITCQLVPNTQ